MVPPGFELIVTLLGKLNKRDLDRTSFSFINQLWESFQEMPESCSGFAPLFLDACYHFGL
jgi:hypothetical protein